MHVEEYLLAGEALNYRRKILSSVCVPMCAYVYLCADKTDKTDKREKVNSWGELTFSL